MAGDRGLARPRSAAYPDHWRPESVSVHAPTVTRPSGRVKTRRSPRCLVHRWMMHPCGGIRPGPFGLSAARRLHVRAFRLPRDRCDSSRRHAAPARRRRRLRPSRASSLGSGGPARCSRWHAGTGDNRGIGGIYICIEGAAMSVKRPLVGLARWWQERLKERGTKSPIWRPTARAEEDHWAASADRGTADMAVPPEQQQGELVRCDCGRDAGRHAPSSPYPYGLYGPSGARVCDDGPPGKARVRAEQCRRTIIQEAACPTALREGRGTGTVARLGKGTGP